MIRKLFTNAAKYTRNLTLRRKLLLSYFILIFSPLVILTIVSYNIVSKGYENKILYSASQSFDQAHEFLNYKINNLVSTSDIIYFNDTVQSVLSSNYASYIDDVFQQNKDMLKLSDFLAQFKNNGDIYRASLYVPGWMIFSNQNINFFNMAEFEKSPDYNKLSTSNEKVFWLPPQTINETDGNSISVIPLLRRIRNYNHVDKFIGIIQIFTLENNIKNVISKASTVKNGVVFLQNSYGRIISSSNDTALKSFNFSNALTKKLANGNISWDLIRSGKDRFIVKSSSINNTDWVMVNVIPYSEITSQSNNIRNIMLLLMLILGIIAYIISYFISTSSINRLTLLDKTMKKVEEGDLDIMLKSNSSDEIDSIFKSFNYMVRRIKLLAEEQFKTGRDLKNMELKALQAQINPHFLYNTLDLINWKAIDNDVPDIADITQSLAKFYKLSLNKGKDIVSIRDEIDHVSTYIQIQNLRFDNRISFVIDIDEKVFEYSILKIVLQPIVENSILHGILQNRSKENGIIKITGSLSNDFIILSITDDGVGISDTRLKEIFSETSQSESKGYGIKNINSRIMLHYGEQYGLSFKSLMGCGTTVDIKIPAILFNCESS
jgi:two-component system, sensor histidine kinase YesM